MAVLIMHCTLQHALPGAALLQDRSRARVLESCCMMTSSFQIADASSG